MKCPFCGHDNDDKATVCNHCFAEIHVKEDKKDKKDKKTERS